MTGTSRLRPDFARRLNEVRPRRPEQFVAKRGALFMVDLVSQ